MEGQVKHKAHRLERKTKQAARQWPWVIWRKWAKHKGALDSATKREWLLRRAKSCSGCRGLGHDRNKIPALEGLTIQPGNQASRTLLQHEAKEVSVEMSVHLGGSVG